MFFGVGIFLDFARRPGTTRAPRGAHVGHTCGEPNEFELTAARGLFYRFLHRCTQFLQDQNITRSLFTPSLLQLIMDTLTPEQITQRLGHMRQVRPPWRQPRFDGAPSLWATPTPPCRRGYASADGVRFENAVGNACLLCPPCPPLCVLARRACSPCLSAVPAVPAVRQVWLCGEVVTVDLATSFGKLTPDTELLNLYSISECHDATIGDLKTELDTSQKYVMKPVEKER